MLSILVDQRRSMCIILKNRFQFFPLFQRSIQKAERPRCTLSRSWIDSLLLSAIIQPCQSLLFSPKALVHFESLYRANDPRFTVITHQPPHRFSPTLLSFLFFLFSSAFRARNRFDRFPPTFIILHFPRTENSLHSSPPRFQVREGKPLLCSTSFICREPP